MDSRATIDRNCLKEIYRNQNNFDRFSINIEQH